MREAKKEKAVAAGTEEAPPRRNRRHALGRAGAAAAAAPGTKRGKKAFVRLLVILAGALLVIAAPRSLAAETVFTNDPEGFSGAASALGPVTSIDFEALPDGTPLQDRDPLNGDEYASLGVTFHSPNYPLRICGPAFWQPTNSLSPGECPFDPEHEQDGDDDDLVMRFDPPVVAAGFALVDNPPGQENESVTFLDPSGGIIAQLNYVPSLWVGLVSPDVPIGEIQIEERLWDGDDIDYDNIRFVSHLAAQIDIKPGSDPNSINLKSKGVTPVAILTTEDFDATTVDPQTVEFAGAWPVHYALEDVEGDGDLDLVMHFSTEDTNIEVGDDDACLVGYKYDGVEIGGCDSVRTIPEEEWSGFRGTWNGQLGDLGAEAMIVEASFAAFAEDPDDSGSFLASGSFSLYEPGASETLQLPLAARFTRTGDGTYDVVILASVSLRASDPWATTMKLTGQADIAGGSLEGTWFIKLPDGTIIQGPWWTDHVNRRVPRAPEVTLGPETDLWFWGDAYVALSGPASLPPEMRDSCIILGSMSNVVMSAVRVEMPLGMSVILPPYTDVFSPGVDWTTLFRFSDCVPLPAVPGGTYRFVALDAVGEPVPGVEMTDVWVGVDPPDPPSNVSPAVTTAGLELAWDEVPEIPGSFDPDADPQLGFYQISIDTVAGPGPQSAYGANGIAVASHTIPWSNADFVEGEHGLALGELPPGFYRLGLCVHSVAPEGTAGHGFEYNNSDPAESVDFQVTAAGDVILP